MPTTKPFQNYHLYRFDPVAYWLVDKLCLSPLSLGFLTAVVSTGLYLFTAWISNTLWSSSGQVGLLQDWLPWVLALFINPIVSGYYLWSFQAIDKVVKTLEASNVLGIDQTEIEEISQISLNAYRSKWRRLLALSIAVSSSIIVCITRFALNNSWTGSHPLPILMITLLTFGVVYMGSGLAINLITNIWILHRVLKNALERREFNVNPLHPDRCGGLRALSEYSLKAAYLIAVLGILVGLIEYQFITGGVGQIYWFVHLVIPLYILLSIGFFFGPLVAAHRGMERAKEELLHSIARQFQADYTQIHSSLTGDAEFLSKGASKIQELQAFYKLTSEFPVWPFDVQTFRQFSLTVSAPFLPILLGILQKAMGLLLKKWGIELP